MKTYKTDEERYKALLYDKLTDEDVRREALAITSDEYRYFAIFDCKRINTETVQAMALARHWGWLGVMSRMTQGRMNRPEGSRVECNSRNEGSTPSTGHGAGRVLALAVGTYTATDDEPLAGGPDGNTLPTDMHPRQRGDINNEED